MGLIFEPKTGGIRTMTTEIKGVPMTIRFVTTRTDVVLGTILMTFRQWTTTGLLFFVSAGFAGLTASRPELQTEPLVVRWLEFAAVFLVFSGAIAVFTAGTVSLIALINCRQKGILGEHTLAITEDSLIEATSFNESKFRWEAYYATFRTRWLLFVCPIRNMAIPVPRRRPLLEGDVAAFEKLLSETVSSARKREG